MIEMAKKQIIPAELKFVKNLAETISLSKTIGSDCKVAEELLAKVNDILGQVNSALINLETQLAAAKAIKGNKEKAFAYRDNVKTAMDALRKPADELEKITDKEIWPFPTYEDLLFEV